MLRIIFLTLFLLAASGLAVVLSGCNQSTSPDSPVAAPADAVTQATAASQSSLGEEIHGHQPGVHGGLIASLGSDAYHVEAVFEQGGSIKLYMLGPDETRVQEVETQELVAYAKSSGDPEAQSFSIHPEPQPGDAAGKTSLFVGKLPDELAGQNVSVTIPNIRIGGERFRFAVQSVGQEGDTHAMPKTVGGDASAELYLIPGGLYTAADIDANGHQTAAQRFKGFRAAHDLKPKPGDPICPVTLTKANPKVAWTIGGQKYEFCCPPCVDEFLTLAKESPDEIKPPQEYVQQ